MGKQLFVEDIDIGTTIGPVARQVTTQQLVKYAGASGDYYEIHYDKDIALENDLPGVILHGALKSAFLAQLLTDWMGEQGILQKLSCQYRGMDIPYDTLTCKGEVTKKYVEDGQHLVECNVWLESNKGGATTPGSATVILPSRSSKRG